jgi:hypothetical protein
MFSSLTVNWLHTDAKTNLVSARIKTCLGLSATFLYLDFLKQPKKYSDKRKSISKEYMQQVICHQQTGWDEYAGVETSPMLLLLCTLHVTEY